VRKYFLLILVICSLWFVPACTPTCSEELTAAQCANQGDTVAIAEPFSDNPPTSENLISVKSNVYQPVLEGSLPSQIPLTENGFNWLYFDPGTNDLCYQVIFTLSEE
jgi:hypothetical protein